jgi:hypothetical protein
MDGFEHYVHARAPGRRGMGVTFKNAPVTYVCGLSSMEEAVCHFKVILESAIPAEAKVLLLDLLWAVCMKAKNPEPHAVVVIDTENAKVRTNGVDIADVCGAGGSLHANAEITVRYVVKQLSEFFLSALDGNDDQRCVVAPIMDELVRVAMRSGVSIPPNGDVYRAVLDMPVGFGQAPPEPKRKDALVADRLRKQRTPLRAPTRPGDKTVTIRFASSTPSHVGAFYPPHVFPPNGLFIVSFLYAAVYAAVGRCAEKVPDAFERAFGIPFATARSKVEVIQRVNELVQFSFYCTTEAFWLSLALFKWQNRLPRAMKELRTEAEKAKVKITPEALIDRIGVPEIEWSNVQSVHHGFIGTARSEKLPQIAELLRIGDFNTIVERIIALLPSESKPVPPPPPAEEPVSQQQPTEADLPWSCIDKNNMQHTRFVYKDDEEDAHTSPSAADKGKRRMTSDRSTHESGNVKRPKTSDSHEKRKSDKGKRPMTSDSREKRKSDKGKRPKTSTVAVQPVWASADAMEVIILDSPGPTEVLKQYPDTEMSDAPIGHSDAVVEPEPALEVQPEPALEVQPAPALEVQPEPALEVQLALEPESDDDEASTQPPDEEMEDAPAEPTPEPEPRRVQVVPTDSQLPQGASQDSEFAHLFAGPTSEDNGKSTSDAALVTNSQLEDCLPGDSQVPEEFEWDMGGLPCGGDSQV